MSRFKIIETGGCDECAEINLFSNAATYERQVLDGYQVDCVVLDLKNERKWNLTYQSKEKNNGLECYAGWEMAAAQQYGCDTDKSYEFLSYYEDTEAKAEALAIYDECLDIAETMACEYLKKRRANS